MSLVQDHTRSVWCELGCFCVRPHTCPLSDRLWEDQSSNFECKTKQIVQEVKIVRQSFDLNHHDLHEMDKTWRTILRKMWPRSRWSAGEVGQMEIRYSACTEGSRLCCIQFELSGRERRAASHPHRLPFLFSWRGKQDVFHPARLRDQSERLLRWNWPQFAPLRVSHLSNIYNSIVRFTSPPPPPAEQLTSFPSCMACCLIHLTDSSSLWAHYCTIYGLCMDATTYLKSTLFSTIYGSV